MFVLTLYLRQIDYSNVLDAEGIIYDYCELNGFVCENEKDPSHVAELTASVSAIYAY